MVREKSVGAIIFYVQGSTISYLVLQYRHRGWEFARGHVEPGEDERETAQREITEETGLSDLQFVDGFREEKTWQFTNPEGDLVSKQAVFYLARSYTMDITLNNENLDYKWLPYQSTYSILAFDESKDILAKAQQHINQALH